MQKVVYLGIAQQNNLTCENIAPFHLFALVGHASPILLPGTTT